MPRPEEEGRPRGPDDSEPTSTSPLPPELATFLQSKDVACLMHETNQGTVFIIKMPEREIRSVRGKVPVELRHELYQHARAPVIRTVIRMYDQPERPLGLETFTNIEQADQRIDFERLSNQEEVLLLYYDDRLTHRLTKRVGHPATEQVRNIVNWAERIRRTIPDATYDFDRAKADVMKATSL